MHAFVPPMMPRDDIAAYYDLYVPDIVDRQDLRFAPASGDLARLPPAIVITAGADLLAAEAEAYADALEAACVDVTLHRQEGALHAYLTLLPDTAASQSTMSEIVGFVARRVVESRS
jgi:acetyl esterase